MLTSRTLEGRFYMVCDRREVNDIIGGVVAMGQQRHAVKIHGMVFMSNHFHMVVTGDNPEQIAGFMKYVKSNLTREFNILRRRSGTMWHRRYDMEVSDYDERSHVQMLAYVLAHGAKEGLVQRPQMWPGVSSAAEVLDGAGPQQGVWVRRTAMGRTTAKVIAEQPERFYVPKTVELSPLPTLEHLDVREQRATLQAAVDAAIEARREATWRPARSRAEAQRRARATDWQTKVGDPRGKHLRTRRPAPWRRESTVAAIRAICEWYAYASRRHRAGLACEYPPFTIPAWLRMGEDKGATFKRLKAAVRKEWAKRPKTGVRYGPGTHCRPRPPPPGGR